MVSSKRFDIKTDIGEIMNSKGFRKARKAAIKRAHDYLKTIDMEVSPVELVLFLSHVFSHILMGAPEKDNIGQMVGLFLADLDLEELTKSWEQAQKDEAEDEEIVATVH